MNFKKIAFISLIISIFILVFSIGIYFIFIDRTEHIALTEDEKDWLKNHDSIRLAPDPYFPPLEFFNEKGVYSGVCADYIKLISKRTGIKFTIVKYNSWDEVVEGIKNREADVLNGVVETPERKKFLFFPKPYLYIPSVIITRKSSGDIKKIEDLFGRRISMVSGYGHAELIRTYYPDIEIVPAIDLKTALRNVSFGLTEAFLGDLATASFCIEEEKISNLRVISEYRPVNVSGFAVRNDWPELVNILEKATMTIKESERDAIFRKWTYNGDVNLFVTKNFWLAIIFFCSILIGGIVFIGVWIYSLSYMVKHKTKELNLELEKEKRILAELDKSKKKLEVLLKEVHHRVKNNLQIISSLLRLQSMDIDDEKFKKAFEESQLRIQSISIIHEKLYKSETLSEINFKEYINSLFNELIKSMSFNASQIDINIYSEDIKLSIDTAIPLGIIINEIITNCFKYAFKNKKGEKLDINFIKKGGKYTLTISDNGPGIPGNFNIETSTTLGMRLINNLTKQIDGSVKIENSGGLKYIIEFKC